MAFPMFYGDRQANPARRGPSARRARRVRPVMLGPQARLGHADLQGRQVQPEKQARWELPERGVPQARSVPRALLAKRGIRA